MLKLIEPTTTAMVWVRKIEEIGAYDASSGK
jgi:hypothetical protein